MKSTILQLSSIPLALRHTDKDASVKIINNMVYFIIFNIGSETITGTQHLIHVNYAMLHTKQPDL